MIDYGRLVALLKNKAWGENDDHECFLSAGDMRQAATAIETLRAEVEELKRNVKYTDGLVQDWRRIANAMGYEPSALDTAKPIPEWLTIRIAMFKQILIEEATETLRAELASTEERLGEAQEELQKIAEAVGEGDDPWSAWETIDLIIRREEIYRKAMQEVICAPSGGRAVEIAHRANRLAKQEPSQ